jgi:hypothetical protein
MGDSIISRVPPKIVQTTGTSSSNIMSQNAVNTELNKKVDRNAENFTIYNSETSAGIMYAPTGIYGEISMNDGTDNIYSLIKNLDDTFEGSRIIGTLDKIYYTKAKDDNTFTDGEEISTLDAVDAKIAAAQITAQKWKSAVQTYADLPVISTSDTIDWLCRVIKGDGTHNTGVYQCIAGSGTWTYFSDNLDFVDEDELETALTNYYTKSEIDTKQSEKQNQIAGGTAGNLMVFSGTPGTVNAVTPSTVISASSTDAQIPTAKAVYNLIGYIATALDNINGEVV